jgi:hypothetical protein
MGPEKEDEYLRFPTPDSPDAVAHTRHYIALNPYHHNLMSETGTRTSHLFLVYEYVVAFFKKRFVS